MTAIPLLAEFAATGAMGPLRPGASLHEIAAVLGPPWDMGRVSKRRRWPHLFSYDDVELCVCRCRRVTSMSVQTWRDAIRLPVPDSKGAVSHAGSLTVADVVAGLQAAGCVARPVPHDSLPPGQLTLRAEPSGVTFTFGNDGGTDCVLARVGSWIATHDCVPPGDDVPDDGFGATGPCDGPPGQQRRSGTTPRPNARDVAGSGR